MATFRKRPGPGGRTVWQAQIIKVGYSPQYRTFDNKAAANLWVQQIESEMGNGTFVSRAEAEATSLSEALERYEQEISPRKKITTVARERDRIRALANSALGQRSLASIRGKNIASLVRDMEASGLGANTIRLYLALLSHLFNVARTAWGMESLSNPVDIVKGQRPRLPQGRDRRLEGDEQARLLGGRRELRTQPQGPVWCRGYRGHHHLGYRDRHAARGDHSHALGACGSAAPGPTDSGNQERDRATGTAL